MKGSSKVIELLNNALTKELTAINQYFIHSKMCENWGYTVLAKKYYEESLGEMKHAEELIKRILFLEGTPNMTRYDKIKVGDNVKKQLESDLQIELDAIEMLRPGIRLCLEELDHASRELLEHILVDEEEHVDWIEGQLHVIKEAGYDNYLAQQIHAKEPGPS
jgi:bacterioferritin